MLMVTTLRCFFKSRLASNAQLSGAIPCFNDWLNIQDKELDNDVILEFLTFGVEFCRPTPSFHQ